MVVERGDVREHEGTLGTLVTFLGRSFVQVLPLLADLHRPVALVLLVLLSLSAAFLRLDLVALLFAVLSRVHLGGKLRDGSHVFDPRIVGSGKVELS